MRFGSFTLDSSQRRMVGAGGEVHLTPKAFDLLVLLIHHAPRVVPKADIHAVLWPQTFVSDAALVSLVKEIRRALDDRDASSRIVRTVHGVGYAFRAAVHAGGDGASHTCVGGRDVEGTSAGEALGAEDAMLT